MRVAILLSNLQQGQEVHTRPSRISQVCSPCGLHARGEIKKK